MVVKVKPKVSNWKPVVFFAKCTFVLNLLAISFVTLAADVDEVVPIGKEGLPQLDETLKDLVNRSAERSTLRKIERLDLKGYKLNYHVGSAKVSLVATNATEAPQS